MTLTEIELICDAIKEQTKQLIEAQQKHYGFYQLCPKCDGEGRLPQDFMMNKDPFRTCPVCNGEKKLIRPEIK